MSEQLTITSPNQAVMPVTACVNGEDHLQIASLDVVDLANKYGTPLWIIDEATIQKAAQAILDGLKNYPKSTVLYAAKAFQCLAMSHLIKKLGFGIDVVSEGELHTALEAGMPSERIFLHGNNKSDKELSWAISTGGARIIVDNAAELDLLIKILSKEKNIERKANILCRVIPEVETDTHHHIQTGHAKSKFGIPISEIDSVIQKIQENKDKLNFLGLHAHIGSQSQDLQPFLENITVLANLYDHIRNVFQLELEYLDVGGGLGIAYTDKDKPISLNHWARECAESVKKEFSARNLKLPHLMLEPGRSLVGTSGVTIYRMGHVKTLPDGTVYLPVDGGMADNPRPITYDALYTARIANNMSKPEAQGVTTLVGKFCESGDVIIKESKIDAEPGDLIAVFGTGAYNYSMASNYNRTPRPACLLVNEGQADVIIERETLDDLLRLDKVPKRFL